MASDNPSLYAAFRDRCAHDPARIALTLPGGSVLSYADLEAQAARLANFLGELGLVPGDRVSVQVEKSPQALCLYLACLRAGLVFHPLNVDYLEDELRFFLSDAEPALFVCDPGRLDAMETLCAEVGVAPVLTLGADGGGTLIHEASRCSTDAGVLQLDADDPACLLYSSGTTGRPKGIPVSHRNLLSNGLALVETWGFSDRDVLLHALPIHHAHGLFVGLNCVFLAGASMNWLPAFDPDAVIDLLPQSTVFMGVPTYYSRLLEHPQLDREQTAGMRLFVSGSAPLQIEVFEAFAERTGHRILERYGMSETGMNCSNPLHGERRPGTVGPALPGVTVRVVDDAGQPLAAGEIGNLQVRGDNVFRGYWKLPEKSDQAFTDDGFFDTGDQATLDDDGRVSIVGRSKDMVITGGLNVYPRELELIINELAGVRESAVIGVPHPDFGEGIVAVVVCDEGGTAPSEEALIAQLKSRVSRFKVPKHVFFLDALPRNTMGKVQKNVLRERYEGLFAG